MRTDDDESGDGPWPDDDLPQVLRGESAGLVLDRSAVRSARPEWSADSEVVNYPHRSRVQRVAVDQRAATAAPSTTFEINEFLLANRQPLLVRLCWFCHGDRELAEDVVQETCIVAYRYRGQLAQHPCPSGWLYTVAVRAAINVFQRERLGRRKEIEALERQGKIMDRPDSFEELLDALPDARERQVITLGFLYGYSRRQVADALGISERTVTSVKSSALQRLKSLLTAEGDQS